jgi:hypothetical protein
MPLGWDVPVHLDTAALEFLAPIVDGPIVLATRIRRSRKHADSPRPSIPRDSKLSVNQELLILEVNHEPSSADVQVLGTTIDGSRALQAHGPGLPETIAAVLLHIRDVTGLIPVAYFQSRTPWSRALTGDGRLVRTVAEMLAAAESDAAARPKLGFRP